MRELLLPWSGQPTEAARVNPRHWLANDLVFATDGRDGFVWHQPTAPAVYGLQSRPVVASGPLGGVLAWVPDGSNITRWDIPPMAANGTTLACWVQGVASTSTDTAVSLSNSSAANGARSIRRLSTEEYTAARISSAPSTAGDSSSPAADNTWHFVVATFTSDTSSDLWLNGVRAAEGSGNSRAATAMNTFVVGASIPNGSLYGIATTAILGIGPAYLINRVLSADEALAWSYEALADPWALFEEQRIFVPVSAGAGTSHDAIGSLAAQSATVAGSAAAVTTFTSSGAPSAQAATVAGSANHLTLHTSSGVLEAQAATVSGSADHAAGGAFSATGELSAQAATVAGSAAHLTLHTATGALVADSAAVSGSALHNTTHAATGALEAGSAQLSGSAIDESTYVPPADTKHGGSAYRREGFAAARKRLALQRLVSYLTEEDPAEETKRIIREVKAGKPILEDKAPPVVMPEVSAQKLAEKLIPSRVRAVQAMPDVELQAVIRKAIRLAQESDDEDVLLLL